MEHEVFVPVPGERLRAALADPVRVARAVPGFQQDAGSEPLSGRLKVRVGGTAITYRGAVRVLARDDGSYAVEGEGGEVRGSGKVTFALEVRLRDTDGGSTLVFGGTASAAGRVAQLPADTVTASVTRLLNRFARDLAGPADPGPAHSGPADPARESGEGAGGATAPEHGGPADAVSGPAEPEDAVPLASDVSGLPVSDVPQDTGSLATEDFEPAATGDFEATPDGDDAPPPPPLAQDTTDAAAPEGTAPTRPGGGPDEEPPDTEPGPRDPGAAGADGPGTDGPDADAPDADAAPLGSDDADAVPLESDVDAHVSVFDTAVPPSALDPVGDDDVDFTGAGEPPAEAAHARRTMIGRSAEEVDHAPPRGRYAPVPAPQSGAANSVLRWAAPAAAVALASAIVVGRALRRRR